MKAHFRHLALMLLLALPAAADPAGKAAELEARLKETAEASPAGAALMLELIDGYAATARHEDVIVTAGSSLSDNMLGTSS